ncbi:MAG TPA: glycosyltransferase family 39 protein [Candidatus Binatia bacterium]|nr:glycosyltransferase family 39 protein [Candidatus Binatia bacterium]
MIAARRASPHGASSRRSLRAGLVAIAAVGAALRVLYVVTASPELSGQGDWRFYHFTAGELAAGRGYRMARPALGSDAVVTTAAHPPLYPLALAVAVLGGARSETAQRLVGAALGVATIAIAAVLARRVDGPATALVAAALVALSPSLIAADGALLSETLFAPLVALVLLCALALRASPGPGRAFALGVAIGVAALARGEGVLLLPLVAVPLGTATRRRVAIVLAATLGCALPLLPWVARNWAVFGRPVLLSTNACGVVAGANCGATYAGPAIGGWRLECLAPPAAANEADQAALWCQDGIRYARQHADRVPRVVAARLLRVWNLFPSDFWSVGEGRLARVEHAAAVAQPAIVIAAIAGTRLLYRRGKPVWILWSPAVMASVAAVLGWGLRRLTVAAAAPLLVLAAVAVVAIASSIRARSRLGR